MIDRRATCSTCRFWAGRFDVVEKEWTPWARCQRFPPMGESWRQTNPTDWCGEHQEHLPSAPEMGMEARK